MTDDAGEPVETAHQPIADKINLFLTSELFWLQSAFIVGLGVIFLTGVSALVAVFNLTGKDLADRVDVIYKLALLGVVVVTFCTVLWRGLITTRQADAQLAATNLQRIQVDKLSQQIEASQENTLADLLQKGAELIGESAKKSNVAAGIALLQFVLEAPNDKFAAQAMNLLADFVQDNYDYGIPNDLAAAAISALAQGDRKNRQSSRRLAFNAKAIDASRSDEDWVIIKGVAAVRYLGGKSEIIEESSFNTATRISFYDVKFEHSEIDLRLALFRDCSFESCDILGGSAPTLKRNTFRSCDFSNAEISGQAIPDLRDGANYYFHENPPTGRIRKGWSSVLEVVMPMPEPSGDIEEVG